MRRTLEEKRIVLAGSRKLEELAVLIEKRGGIPIVRSLQGLTTLAETEIEAELRGFLQHGADWSIFTTGTGLEALIGQTDKLGFRDAFLQKIKHSRVGSRGYKTYGLLKSLEIHADVADTDGTIQGLLAALSSEDFSNKRVFVQLHGEAVPELIRFLEDRNATVQQIMPYRHIPPEAGIVSTLCHEIGRRNVDAVLFTTAVQVKYLFEYAKQHGLAASLQDAFRNDVIAVAVGRVTAEALKTEGMERFLVPESERMGAMVVELGTYFTERN